MPPTATHLPRRRRRLSALVGALAVIGLFGTLIPNVFAAPPAPTVALNVGATALVGSNISFTATFSNPSDTGYGPFIDLVMPKLGADGGVTPPDNGITFSSATYLGVAVTSTVQTVPVGGCVTEPYAYAASGAKVVTCGLTPGDQYVSLQLPFGSFTSAQPSVPVVINAAVSNLARVGTPLTISAKAGFTYGADALHNPTSDPSLISSPINSTVTPTVISVAGSFIAPEGETATGPAYPRTYRVDVSVAPGQTLTNLDISSVLPANLQYLAFGSSTPASSAISTPSTSTPGGTMTRRFASITGTGGTDATFTFSVYVPRLDSGSTAVINPTTGSAASSTINNSASGTWTPLDFPRQPVATATASSTATLTDRAIAIQSSVAITTDSGPAGLSPGDTLTWSLPFQVSDYFAFKDVVIDDKLGDGSTFAVSPVPTISLSGNGFSISNATIEPIYYTAVLNVDGTTSVHVDISAWLAAHGYTVNVVGGCILPAGSVADCTAHNNGPVSGTVTFKSVVDSSYHAPQGGGHDQYLNQGDVIHDSASISGTVLVNTTLASTGNTASDGNASVSSPGTSSSSAISVGTLTKSVYAINGVIGSSARIKAGDVVTYRIVQTMPISSSEIYSITDYLPMPIFSAASVTTFSPTVSAAAPPSGTAKFGPTDTFSTYVSVNPTLSSSGSANSLTFDYGNVTAVTSALKQTDLLFSVTVSTDPFADGLSLTNQAQSIQGSTNTTSTYSTAIIALSLDEPQITAITKGAIASSNGAATFTPASKLPAGVSVSAPGSACPRLTGAVTSAGIATTPITADAGNVMAGDRVTFALTVENTGHAPAFDVKVSDILPTGFVAPSGGINLCVQRGDGTTLTYTGTAADFLSGAGIVLDDSGTGALAAGKDASSVVNATGSNIAIVTFDLQVDTVVNPGNQVTNTGSIAAYSSIDGGPNFIPAGLSDSAVTTIATPSISKTLTSTSVANTTGNSVLIGEVATFTTVVTVPGGTMPSSVVTDALPANFAFVGCTSVTSSSAGLTSSIGAFSTACNPGTNPTVGTNGTPVTFNLGTLTNTSGVAQTVTLVYTAVPTNVAANVSGTSLTSPASLAYTNAFGAQGTSSSSVGVSVVEPKLTVSTTSNVTTGEAGTQINYTTTVSRNAGTSTADGFDLALSIPLPTGLSYVPASVSCTGQATSGCSFSGNTGTVTWSSFANTATTTVITYSATLDANVTPNTAYALTTPLTWTSISGSPTQISAYNTLSYERTGNTGNPGGAANNYTATSTRTVTTNSPASSKLLVTSSESASTGNNLLIGEIVRYRLVATIPAGSSPNATMTDLLPTGLQFINDGTAKIAFVSNGAGMITDDTALNSACPSSLSVSGTGTTIALLPQASVTCVIPAGNITGGPFAAGTDPVITLGNITNNDRDADVESVVVELNAVVLNVAANVGGTTISNMSRLRDNGVNYNSSNFNQTVISPTVTIAKTILTPPNNAGGNISYQLVVTNTSTFSTFDVRVTDTLNVQLIHDAHSVTAGPAWSSDASSGNAVDLTWNTLTAGQSVTIKIDGHVDPLASSGSSIPNTGTVTWTSLPGTGGTVSNPTGSSTPGAAGTSTGERTGSGVAPNTYTASSSASTTLVTPTIVKTGSPSTIAVGDTITYNLVTTLAEGTTKNLIVNDGLPSGMTYLGSTVITTAAGSGGLLTADFPGTLTSPVISAPGSGGPVTFTFGDTVNPADGNATNNKFLVRITARVRNIAANVRGTVISNTGSVTYTDPNTLLPVTANAPSPVTSTVIEPKLNVTHTVSVAAPRNDAGGVVTYQIVVTPNVLSNATAFDAALSAAIPAGMTYVPSSLSCSTGTITPATCSVSGQTVSATWATFPTGSDTTIITYQAKFDDSVNPSQTLTNSSALTWQSLPTDGTNPHIRTGADGAAGSPNNYAASSSVGVTVVAQTIAKALISTSEAATTGSNVAIGETATYTLTVTLPEGTTPSLTIADLLPAGLDYVGGSLSIDTSSFNGTLPAPSITAPGGDGVDIGLVFGTTTVVSDNVTTNDSFTITFSAKVLNISGNVRGTVRGNSATAQVGAGSPVSSGTVNVTVVEPTLTSTLVPSTTTPQFGATVGYTYTLSHSGASNADADDLVVTVTIPPTTAYAPGSAVAPSGWTVDETSLPGTLRFTGSVFAVASGNRVFTWDEVMPGIGDTTIGTTSQTSVSTTYTSLVGTVTGERTGTGVAPDTYVTNANATVTLTGIDLAITSDSDGGITAVPGQAVPYVINYRNNGNTTATGVVLTATVPANSTFDATSSSAGWSCADGTPGPATCTLAVGSLAASGTGSKTLVVHPTDPWGVGVTKLLSTTSSIADDGTHGPDGVPANNDGSDTTPISAVPDLTVSITDGQISTVAGATNDYVISTSNVGTQDAAGVVITMTVPAHTTFVPGSSDPGWVCAGGNVTPGTVCTLAVGNLGGNGGSSSGHHFIVTVDDPIAAATTSITATTSVADDGSGGVDPTPANNIASDSDAVPQIDLSLTLSGGLAHQGIPYVITVTVSHNWISYATGVESTIILPPGLTYISDDGAGAFDPDTDIWMNGTLMSPQTQTLHITVMPTFVGTPTVTAEITHALQSDIDSTPANGSTTEDDDDTLTVTVDPTADLSVTKTVDLDSVDVGDTVVFTVTAHNAGPNDAASVEVADLLPAGLTYVSDDGAGDYDDTTGIWTIGTLAADGTTTLEITATVATLGDHTNTATVSSPTFDPTPADNISSAEVYAKSSDLSVVKTRTTPVPNYLGEVTYLVTVTNNGPDDTHAAITDLLPAGLAYVSDDGGGDYDDATGIWTVGELAVGESAQLHITAQAVATGLISNTATVTANDHYDPIMANNTSTADMTVAPGVDDSVTITADDTSPAYHQTVVLTVTAHNDGPDTAADSVVGITLPGGLTYVSDDGAGDYVSGTGIWTLGDLTAGETRTLHITVDVISSGTLNIPAAISTSTYDHNSANDSDLETLEVPYAADLGITKTVDEPAPKDTDNVTYTLTVHNDGPDTAHPTVTDLLPAGLIYVSDDGSGAYDPDTGIWTLGALISGSSATLHITAKTDMAGPITNTAVVSAPEYDENLANNFDSALIIVVASADVSTSVSPSAGTPDVGDTITLTVVARNDGPDAAQDTELSFVLPPGVTYVSDDAGGAYDPDTGVWTLGTLPIDGTSTLHIVVTVTAPGTTDFTSTVTSSTYDPNLANNVDIADIYAPSADLSVTKTVDDATPNYLDQVTYIIKVENDGPDDAHTVVLTDFLPAGVTYVSDTGSGDYDPDTGIWTIGTLVEGDNAALHITVSATTTGTTTNTASVSASTYDPSLANNVTSRDIDVDPAADVSATIIVSDATPDVGQEITYTVTIHNDGPDDAEDTAATITLPSGLTYVSDDGAGSFDPDTGILTIGHLPAGDSVVLIITAKPNVPGTSNVTVAATSSTYDPNIANNHDQVSIEAPLADLTLTKTVSDDAPNYLGNTTFKIKVTNNGPDDAHGVVVSDLLPDGTLYVSDDSGGTYDPGTGVWTIGTIADGDHMTLNIVVKAVETGTATNTASVSAITYDPNLSNNIDNVSIEVPPAGDLAISKVVDQETPNVGDTITFTITVHNFGPDTAHGVSVQETLPLGLEYASDDSGGSYDPDTSVWTIGSLGSGDDIVLHISTLVTESGELLNTATVSASTYDQDPDNNVSTTGPIVDEAADLAVSDAVSDPAPSLGDNVTYTVVATNHGPDTSTGTKVQFPIPAGFSYVSDDAGADYDSDTGTWTIGSLAKGDSVTLHVVLKVIANGTLSTTATISGDLYDPNLSNNVDSVPLTVLTADLGVEKTVSDAAPNYLDEITYTITATNDGPSVATGVGVFDQLPTGLTYISDDSGGDYDADSGFWNVGTLAVGDNAVLHITVSVTHTGTIANDVSVASLDQLDPDESNDSDQSVINVADAADLEVQIEGANHDPNVGQTITFTVTVTNHGPDNATSVVLDNTNFPSNLTYVSDDSGGAYDPDTHLWTIGSLAKDASVSLTFTAIAATVGTDTDDASATTATYEADFTNNDDTWSVTVHPTSDLSLTKTVDEATPHNGTDITYTITVSNAGPNGATGVVVSDQLPAGLSYVSDDGEGDYDAETGLWTIGSIATGHEAVLHITAKVVTTGSIGNTAEVTASDNYDPDSEPDNHEPAEDDEAAATVNAQPTIDLSVSTAVEVLTGASDKPTTILQGPAVNLGGTVSFTITTANDGPDAATGVSTSFIMPAGLTYISDDSGGTYDPDTHIWTIGPLAAGESITFHVVAQVTATGQLDGKAEVMSAFEWDSDSEPANGISTEDDYSASPVFVPAAAALSITKTVPPAKIIIGHTVTWTITIHNDGPDAATSVVVSDALPAGLEYVSASGGTSFDPSTMSWTIASIPNGGDAVLHIVTKVTRIGTLTNVATVEGAETFNPNGEVDGIKASAEADVLSIADPDMPHTWLGEHESLLLPVLLFAAALLLLLTAFIMRRRNASH